MISVPLGMGFPLSAQVLGKRLVICLGSFFMCLLVRFNFMAVIMNEISNPKLRDGNPSLAYFIKVKVC
jgi:hypothetical protein